MTTQTQPAPPAEIINAEPTPASAVEPSTLTTAEPYRFTVAQYLAMGKVGILRKEDRVELIDGVIVDMAAIGNRHLAAVDRFNRAMGKVVGDRAIVRVQGSIDLNEHTRPEPDLVLLRERADFYESEAAGPGDVLLLIEVSDTSLDYDRNEKLALYANAGIPEVWITALPERIIEAHTEPVGGRYTQVRIFSPGDTISPGCFPDLALPVSEILPG